MPKKGKHAPLEGLKAFMYVMNAHWKAETDGKEPTAEKPRYWVGRVSEIMRSGWYRLHWYKESEPGSGLFRPTNNYFRERVAALRQFKTSVRDKAAKGWRLYPII